MPTRYISIKNKGPEIDNPEMPEDSDFLSHDGQHVQTHPNPKHKVVMPEDVDVLGSNPTIDGPSSGLVYPEANERS